MAGFGFGYGFRRRPQRRASGGAPTPMPAPAFTTQPSISPSSGTAGETTFTADDGAASNATDLARRWLLNGTAIGTGATVLPASDGSLVLEVTATGPTAPPAVATSAPVTVAAAPGPSTPVNTSAPVVTGLPYVSRTMTASAGTWDNTPTAYTYQWRRTNLLTGATAAIAGATSGTYALVAADKNCSIGCDVIASNAAGSSAPVASSETIGIMPSMLTSGSIGADGDSVQAGLNANSTDTDIDANFALGKQYANELGMTYSNRAAGSRTLSPHTQAPTNNTVFYSIFTTGNNVGADKKDRVFIAAGGNDALSGASYNNVTNFTTYYRRIIGKLLDAGYAPDQVLIGGMYNISDAALASRSITRAYFLTFNDAIKTVVTEYGLSFFDFYEQMPAAGDISSDNLHPTRQGHTKYAAGMAANQPYSPVLPKVLNMRAPVAGVTVTGGESQVTVGWNAYAGATGMDVRVVNAATFETVVTQSGTGTSMVIPVALAGNYKVQVRAQVAGGQSPYTQSASAAAVTVAAGPTYFLQDTFSGETGEPNITAHTPEIGSNWVAAAGQMKITAAGRAFVSTNGTFVYNSLVAPQANYFVESVVDFLSTPTGNVSVAAGRANVATNSYYRAYYDSAAGAWRLGKSVNGVLSALGSAYADAFTSGSRTVQLRMVGTTISLWVDGVQRVTVTDSSNTTASRIGMGGDNAATGTTGIQVSSLVASAL